LRHLSITLTRCKQLPKTGAENHAWAHPQRYKFRRGKPHQHRPDYQRNEQEVLWDQILQPHYPTAYRFPDYAKHVKHGVQSRHMERNDDLGPARDAMELYGPDQVTYELCRADFEKSRDGFLGIVIMAGANEDTMDDYVYYDNKLKLIKAGANSFSYDDHIIWAYINRERPDLQFLKNVLEGCEEGGHEVLHFVYKEDTKNLPKVLDAIKQHSYMELFGGIIQGECFSPEQIRKWHKLIHEQEIGEILGMLEMTPRALVGSLDQIPRATVNLLSQVQGETTLILDQWIREQSSE